MSYYDMKSMKRNILLLLLWLMAGTVTQALGVPRGEHLDWCADMALKGEERLSRDTTWMPLYGENDRIRDHYNRLVLHYEKGIQQGHGAAADGYDKRKYYAIDIELRAYDEGVTLRYHFHLRSRQDDHHLHRL